MKPVKRKSCEWDDAEEDLDSHNQPLIHEKSEDHNDQPNGGGFPNDDIDLAFIQGNLIDHEPVIPTEREKQKYANKNSTAIYFGKRGSTSNQLNESVGESGLSQYPSMNLLEAVHGISSAHYEKDKSPRMIRSCDVSALLCLGMLVEEYTQHISTPFKEKYDAYRKTSKLTKRPKKKSKASTPTNQVEETELANEDEAVRTKQWRQEMNNAPAAPAAATTTASISTYNDDDDDNDDDDGRLLQLIKDYI